MVDYEVNVLEELNRMQIEFEYTADGEVKILCPFHDETNPSCGVSVNKKVFNCRSCSAKGDFATLAAKVIGVERYVIVADYGRRYGQHETKIIESSVVEACHQRLLTATPLLEELSKRAVDLTLIRKYRLGEKQGRITIPVVNKVGQFVNLIKYAPGSTAGPKFFNNRGRGKQRLYPIDQLDYADIVICGGMIKAIAASKVLNPHGIGAISATAGEKNWDVEFNDLFKGKRVWIALDVDETGSKNAQLRAAELYVKAEWVGVIDLPIDKELYPKGGIDDFIASGGDILEVVRGTKQWKPTRVVDHDDDDPTDVSLGQAIAPANVHKRLRFRGLASATDQSPYLVPKAVSVRCSRDQPCCAICPIIALNENPVVHIRKESEFLLEMTSSRRQAQFEAVRSALNVPQCKVVEFTPVDYYKVDEVIVTDELSLSNVTTDKVSLHAAFVDCEIDLNETYEIEGRVVPHPKSQRATLIASKAKAVCDDLTSFKLTDEQIKKLKSFQPAAWHLPAISEKLDEIYEELENRVTRIWERRDMHIISDLSYHSPLLL